MEDATNKHRSGQVGARVDDAAAKGVQLPKRDAITTSPPDASGLRGVSVDTNTFDEAPELATLSISDAKQACHKSPIITTHPLVHEYLLKHAPEYERVHILRRKGWESETGDKFFENQRYKADHPDKGLRNVFYHMMCEIATDMDRLTNVISRLRDAGANPKALDLCMAPGGFAGAVLRAIRSAIVCGITLPVEDGGHPMTMPLWETNQRLQTLWLDITMLAAEMGVNDISPDHPDASKFSSFRPFKGQEFDLVFCDGNVLRTQKRETYRELKERLRLLTSQLVLAMQRIKAGGSLIIRFHKLEAVDTATLLREFVKFSSIILMKPTKYHAMRSSFYMIAEDVQPQHPEARRAVQEWKNQWYEATMETNEGGFDTHLGDNVENEKVRELLRSFGPQLIALGEPIWCIQADGLSKSQFIRRDGSNRPNYLHTHPLQASQGGHGQLFGTKPSTSNPWLAGDPRRDPNNAHELAGDTVQDNWSDPDQEKFHDSAYPLGNRLEGTPNPWLNMKPRWTPSTTEDSLSFGGSSQEASVEDTVSDVSSIHQLAGIHQGKRPTGSLLELARQKARPPRVASAHAWRPEKSAAIPIRNPDGELLDPKEFASITPPKKQAVTLKDANGNKVDLADLKAKSPPHFV